MTVIESLRAVALTSGVLLAAGSATIAADLPLAGRWLAEDIGGGGVIDRLQTTLEVAKDGKVAGKGGCNRYAGQAAIKRRTLTFGPLAATRMMCAPAAMDQEQKFFRALEFATGWRIDTRTRKLTLTGADGKRLLTFSRMD